ncbi:MAG TPA: hypothetical protein VGS97_23750 [Actinocrinis sp.]|uniref:hypothetical protein n=1 Tax=Actinocrinis sp. TaxID=1920516 RepID=UPI002DDC933D|nr:hypothetical protein [Actinocrinis sp.]HEV2347134.1 hypothetical protein [Actinocrinis sp.]
MGLLLQLQNRIPDRWFLRRLLPSALFVAVAFIGMALGQSHWNDTALAKQRLTADLAKASGSLSAYTSATVIIYVLIVAAGAFAVPIAAEAVGALAAGAWPWWLTRLGDRRRAARVKRWQSANDLKRKAVRALDAKQPLRAARLKARAAAAQPSAPQTPTWIGDRLEAAAAEAARRLGVDVRTSWLELLLTLPDNARTVLTNARDDYDVACEALVWSCAYLVLGFWWWPAAVVAIILGLTSWHWLRRAAETLASTAEAVSRVAARKENAS